MRFLNPSACVLLGLLVLAAVPTAAQVQPAGLALDLHPGAVELGPNEAREVDVTATNPGSVDGTVELSIDIPEPWQATLSAQRFELAAGATRAITMTITAPGTGPAEGMEDGFTVTGTLTDATGQFEASDQADGQAVLILPPAPAPATSSNTVPLVLSGLGILSLIGVAVWWGSRSRIEAPSIKVGRVVRASSRVVLPVFLRNDSQEGTTVLLSVARVPAGWGLGFNMPEIFLDPGQEMLVWLALKPPSTKPDAQASFDIVARSVEGDAETVARDVAVDFGELPRPLNRGPAGAAFL